MMAYDYKLFAERNKDEFTVVNYIADYYVTTYDIKIIIVL